MPESISASTIEGLLIVEFVSFWSSSWNPFHSGSDFDKSNCVFLLQPQQIPWDRGIPHGHVWRSHGKIKEPRANVMAISWKLDLQATAWRRRYMDWTLWMFVWCSTVMGVLRIHMPRTFFYKQGSQTVNMRCSLECVWCVWLCKQLHKLWSRHIAEGYGQDYRSSLVHVFCPSVCRYICFVCAHEKLLHSTIAGTEMFNCKHE